MKSKYIKRIGICMILCCMVLLTACKEKKVYTSEDITKFEFGRGNDGGYFKLNAVLNDEVGIFTHEGINSSEPIEMEVDKEFFVKIQEFVKTYDIQSWDGFDKDAKGVTDSEGFRLTITYADGSTINASGYHTLPDNYSEWSEAISKYCKAQINGVAYE